MVEFHCSLTRSTPKELPRSVYEAERHLQLHHRPFEYMIASVEAEETKDLRSF